MYSCHSVFMVRTPALPMEVAEKMYGCDYRDIWKYIRDMSLDGYFTESLRIASPSLYEAIKKLGGGGDEKRDRATCLSLYKYLIRAATRTTPYGIFAGVALAEFGSRGVHSVDSGRIHKKISADNLWLYKLIEKIEKNQAALEKLSLIWNKSCYVSGRRMRNPIYSKHGTSENAIKENSSIRYSPLVELVVSSAQDYINYRELVGIIKSAYDYVPDEKVINVINTLIEQEYLLTEIRIPAYCSNTLSYCLGVLERRNILPELREQLNQIQRRFDEYEAGYDALDEIIGIMSSIQGSKSYVKVNSGSSFNELELDVGIKKKIENFVDCIERIGIESKIYSTLKEFKHQFQEEYGQGVEVPLTQVIDPAGFDGLSYMDVTRSEENERETYIKSLFDTKIQEAILNREKKISFSKEDFLDIKWNPEWVPQDSFDINFVVVGDKTDPKLYLGPNIGSSSAGKSFQRFERVFEREEFKKYNSIYAECGSDEYLLTEIREMPTAGRLSNVMNWSNNYPCCFLLGMTDTENKSRRIFLDDIVVGLDYDDKLYLKSVTNDKICKMITDNMLNSMLNSKLFNLLCGISAEYDDIKVIERLSYLFDENYIYTPEVEIEGIVVFPETWRLTKKHFSKLNIEKFREEYRYFVDRFDVPEFFYLCEDDNRLLLRRDDSVTVEIIYQEYGEEKDLRLCALEDEVFQNGSGMNSNGEHFAVECVFSMYRKDGVRKENNSTVQLRSEKEDIDLLIKNKNRKIPMLHGGWVYFKLYCSDDMDNDLLVAFKRDKKSLEIENFFFIRYADESGNHLRLRVKYESEHDALGKLSHLNAWMLKMRENGFLKKWSMHEYTREINRYGGEFCIEAAERLFFKNSEDVIDLLDKNDIKNHEILTKVYFRAVAILMNQLMGEKSDMFTMLDEITNKENHRKEYQNKRKEYIKELEEILQENSSNPCIKDFLRVLEENRGSLTDSKNEIILSLLHMCCNRLNGNRELEEKAYSLLRHTLYDVIKKERYMRKTKEEKIKTDMKDRD